MKKKGSKQKVNKSPSLHSGFRWRVNDLFSLSPIPPVLCVVPARCMQVAQDGFVCFSCSDSPPNHRHVNTQNPSTRIPEACVADAKPYFGRAGKGGRDEVFEVFYPDQKIELSGTSATNTIYFTYEFRQI